MTRPHVHERLNEDTLHEMQIRWADYKKTSKVPPKPQMLRRRAGETVFRTGNRFDCLFLLRKGAVKLIAPAGKQPPLIQRYYANGTNDHPILGARYFFDRRPSSIDYVAETDCEMSAIDSPLILDAIAICPGQLNLIARETVINSDISEFYVPAVLQELGAERVISKEIDLIMACEEIRDHHDSPRRKWAIERCFKSLLDRRIEAAREQDIQPSIFIDTRNLP